MLCVSMWYAEFDIASRMLYFNVLKFCYGCYRMVSCQLYPSSLVTWVACYGVAWLTTLLHATTSPFTPHERLPASFVSLYFFGCDVFLLRQPHFLGGNINVGIVMCVKVLLTNFPLSSAMFVPAAALLCLSFIGCQWKFAVGIICFALFCNGGVAISNLANHADIAPNFAGELS